MKKVAIIDYGAGNLKNVQTALRDAGIEGIITSDKEVIKNSDALILPGVGSFPDAMKNLEQTGLVSTIKECVKEGKILLGICLGMQMLFDKSFEREETDGLGLIPGTVEPLTPELLTPDQKIPHMGWNELVLNHPEDEFLKNIEPNDYVYFVHSFYAVPENFDENVLAWADYSVKVPGIVRNKNVIGTQFHPEKSSVIGAVLLDNLKEMIE